MSITPKSSLYEIYTAVKDVLRPERCVANQLKIVKNGVVIDNPKELSATFGTFFVDKVDAIVEEIRAQKNENWIRCINCGQKFTSIGDLRKHKDSHKIPFSCSECDKMFMNDKDLKEHMKIHKSEKPFSCIKCNKMFKSQYEMKKHDNAHHNEESRTGCKMGDHEKQFSCNECDKRFVES